MPKGGTGKVLGRVVAEHEGLTISIFPRKAKRAGRDRVWIQIRQNDATKRWRVSTSLTYSRSADIQFVNEPSGKNRAKEK